MSFWSETGKLLKGERSLGSMIGTAVRGCRTIRVAVLGSKASGKTVFLTSLANHLRDHRPMEFPIGGRTVLWDKSAVVWDGEANGVRTLRGIPLFDYNAARGALSRGEWPSKTAQPAILALRLRITRPDGASEDVQLELVDIPGERIADFAMMGRSYREWCRWMERESDGSDNYNAYLGKVRELGRIPVQEMEAALLDAYRDFLADEYAKYAPCITPSTVKLELDGTRHGGSRDDFRRGIQPIPVGIRNNNGTVCEFAPLPDSCFEKGSPWYAIAEKFAMSYSRYVKSVVRPAGDWLRDADQMFYLVDVLTLLRSGARAWESERQYGESAIGALCPRSSGSALDRFWKFAQRFVWKTRVRSAYVVATKADAVLDSQDRDRMVVLANVLLGRSLAFLDPAVKRDVLSCAAVCGTRSITVDGKKGLEGRLGNDMEPGKPPAVERWMPSAVPASLPATSANWDSMIQSGDFNFQFAFPWFDAAQVCPPKHLGMNKIVELILTR